MRWWKGRILGSCEGLDRDDVVGLARGLGIDGSQDLADAVLLEGQGEALAADDAARAAFDALSYTRRKEIARSIAEAKRPETRERRLAKAMEELRA